MKKSYALLLLIPACIMILTGRSGAKKTTTQVGRTTKLTLRLHSFSVDKLAAHHQGGRTRLYKKDIFLGLVPLNLTIACPVHQQETIVGVVCQLAHGKVVRIVGRLFNHCRDVGLQGRGCPVLKSRWEHLLRGYHQGWRKRVHTARGIFSLQLLSSGVPRV
jgi:hypothetical protein